MDLKRLRYLVAIADTGSFSAAARRAFVSQPTLSIAMAGLENELQSKLFERGARGVALTDEGNRVLLHARAVLREVEAMAAVKGTTRRARPLRLGLLPTLSPRFVASAVRRFVDAADNRSALVEFASVDQLQRRLSTGRYDAILTCMHPPRRGEHQLKLKVDRQVLAFNREGRPSGKITPRVLHGRPLIVRTHCEFLNAASRILDAMNVRPVIVARTESDEHALALVAAGVGACLMPDSFAHDGVVFARPDGVDLRRNIGWQWINGAPDSIARILSI